MKHTTTLRARVLRRRRMKKETSYYRCKARSFVNRLLSRSCKMQLVPVAWQGLSKLQLVPVACPTSLLVPRRAPQLAVEQQLLRRASPVPTQPKQHNQFQPMYCSDSRNASDVVKLVQPSIPRFRRSFLVLLAGSPLKFYINLHYFSTVLYYVTLQYYGTVQYYSTLLYYRNAQYQLTVILYCTVLQSCKVLQHSTVLQYQTVLQQCIVLQQNCTVHFCSTVQH